MSQANTYTVWSNFYLRKKEKIIKTEYLNMASYMHVKGLGRNNTKQSWYWGCVEGEALTSSFILHIMFSTMHGCVLYTLK